MRSVVVALAVLGSAVAGCGGAAPEAERSGVADWTVAAEAVRPSVLSIWGSRPALGGVVRAFVPVGTGFAVARDGLLITNAHVVATEAGEVLPRLSVLVQSDTGSALYPATVHGLDARRDLAILGIADTALVPLRWRETRAPTGTPLATLGYGLPEGGIVDTAGAQVETRYTVFRRFTAGHSSGYRTLRAGDPSTNVLEVDLFLFPGVSGGPTFDLEGRVVGVNRGHRQFLEGATSYGHVIPRLVVGQFLEEQGRVVGADTASVFGWWRRPGPGSDAPAAEGVDVPGGGSAAAAPLVIFPFDDNLRPLPISGADSLARRLEGAEPWSRIVVGPGSGGPTNPALREADELVAQVRSEGERVRIDFALRSPTWGAAPRTFSVVGSPDSLPALLDRAAGLIRRGAYTSPSPPR